MIVYPLSNVNIAGTFLLLSPAHYLKIHPKYGLRVGMDTLVNILEYVSLSIGIVGIFIVLWGVIVGLVEFIRAQFSHLEKIRIDLGRYLLLGLEFLIAADIIRTIVKPTLEEVAVLLAIVAIRTVISYFLNKEIERLGHGK
jgi:uncharacterized membrane protein